MVAFPVVESPIIAVCARDAYMWVLAPDRDRCMVCGEAPTGVVATWSLAAGADGSLSAEPPAAAPRDAEPAVFERACPSCATTLDVVVTYDDIELRIPEPSNASPPSANGESERTEASSPGDDVDGTGEPAGESLPHTPAGSPSAEERDGPPTDE